MKNKFFIKIGTIVILLLSLVVIMDGFQYNDSTKVSAAGNSGSKVQLEILKGAITCTGWYGNLNLGQATASFSAVTLSGTYTPNSRKCSDTRGDQAWALTITLTGDLVGPLSYTISSGAAGICQTGAALALLNGVTASPLLTTSLTANCASFAALSGILDIMRRQTIATGQLYEYALTPRIRVVVPMNQAPGTYTGTLDIAIPG